MYTVVQLRTRYELVNDNRNWQDAQIICKMKYRAMLAVIANMADQLRLQAYLETINGQPVLYLVAYFV